MSSAVEAPSGVPRLKCSVVSWCEMRGGMLDCPTVPSSYP